MYDMIRRRQNMWLKGALFGFAMVLLAGMAVLPGVAQAQSFSTTINGQATAVVMTGLSVDQEEPLRFGTFIPNPSGLGTVIISPDPNNNLTYNNIAHHLHDNHGPAKFVVTGEVGQSFTVQLPNEVHIENSTGSGSMRIRNFTTSLHGSSKTINNSAGETFYVGGTLEPENGPPPGIYEGTFTVTVAYE